MLHRPDEFFRRIGHDGLIGFGEAYLTGAWEPPDLGRLLTVLAGEIATLVPAVVQTLRALVRRPAAADRTATRSPNTRGNIAATTTCPTTCSGRSSTRR